MENRQDCFARTEHGCSALNELNCNGCRFYRNDLNRLKIEQEINRYSFGTSKRKEDSN